MQLNLEFSVEDSDYCHGNKTETNLQLRVPRHKSGQSYIYPTMTSYKQNSSTIECILNILTYHVEYFCL